MGTRSPHDHRMIGAGDVVADQQLLIELFARAQATECNGNVLLGLAVEPDEHELADRMIRLLSDEKMRAQFGVNARNYALSEWDYNAQAKQLIEFYKRLITLGKRR